MATGAMVVFSNPTEGREDEYNDWYDNTHLPEVCALDGVVGALAKKLTRDARRIEISTAQTRHNFIQQ